MDVCQSVLMSFFVRAASGQFDLDRPEDLARVLAEGGGHRTRAACLEMGVRDRLPVHAISR
jgi:hypothetical protein